MKKYLCVFFVAGLILSCRSVQESKIRTALSEPAIFCESESENDMCGFQVDISFPLDEEKYDSSILTNSFIPFKAYADQGTVYFYTENVKSFLLYLNGKKIDTKKICKNKYTQIYIGKEVINGTNNLLITNIEAEKNFDKEYILSVKIPYPSIIEKKEKLNNVNYRAFQIIDDIMKAEIENGFPSAQIVVVKDGKIIKNSAYGYISTVDEFGEPLIKKQPVTNETLFDLASNTKMYTVNFALQKLLSEEKISIYDKVTDFFPEFKDKKKALFKGKSEITVSDLLKHQAGFPAGAQYYVNKKIRKKKKNDKRENKEIVLELICNTSLIYPPRTEVLYSDIDYILLGLIIEKITGMPLDKYAEENLYKPLNLNSVCYEPLKKGFTKKNIAATEIHAVKRSKDEKFKDIKYLPVHGTVHDPEAYNAMNEVSGHAGLFANAKSIAVLAQVMLNGGGYGNIKLFDSSVLNLFTSQGNFFSQAGLGWRRQGLNNSYARAFSKLASANTIGHTGWTGTLTVIDPKEDLIIIIFTSAKNTPALFGKHLRGKYEGDFYLAKNYGAITTFIYSAFKNYDNDLLDQMLIELAVGRKELLTTMPEIYDNDGFYKDLTAIMDGIVKQSKQSKNLRIFLKSEKGRSMLSEIRARNKNKNLAKKHFERTAK
ncbi:MULTISPECIES: penicillin binding protein PBP4B [unclassified Treponema]|uniref:penicillin binding protein PBP4B n=1 Tax=unclassified Treponema TaxID=2638727 RepID=UPI0020A3BBD6|nr:MULTISPECIES: penicillin binding protein PBP4B [unclassified Treponema]UTC67685.1 penicillin binding protein PBP4B [Treponema sp. OMZ 789]UTC70413.1 penicillin binding protein PBP4B [Treponema sp. OMZ 790]UTC73126.1 penicillin binding protein PBP4B [Treponema sp. OMZ 791]